MVLAVFVVWLVQRWHNRLHGLKFSHFTQQSQRGGMVGQGGIVAIRYQQLALLALLMSLGVDRSVCGLEGIVGIR